MGDDDARRTILARRACFVAVALASACGERGEGRPTTPPPTQPRTALLAPDAGATEDAAPPPALDADADGIPDDRDACPTAPGPPNDDPKKTGCPACLSVVLLRQDLPTRSVVSFAARSVTIHPGSLPILHELAVTLRARPGMTVELAGHSDPTEPAALAEQRALVVRDYLVSREGIDAARLHPRGYGATMPALPNDTVAGRDLNRRVEFTVEGP